MPDGIKTVDSFEDAIALALEDVGLANLAEEEDTMPVDASDSDTIGDDADTDVESEGDQTDQAADVFDFDDDDEVADVPEGPPPTYEVNGKQVPVEELRLGYMRQEDYTQKTQQLAAERKALEEGATSDGRGNENLWKAMKEDPAGTVAYFAKQFGLIDEDVQVHDPGVKFIAESDVQALVEQRVAEAVKQHPTVQQAVYQRLQTQLDSQFAEIANKTGKPLSAKAKIQVIDFATQNGIADVRIAFDALAARRGEPTGRKSLGDVAPQKREAANLSRAKGRQPKGALLDFDQSVKAAMAQLDAQAEV